MAHQPARKAAPDPAGGAPGTSQEVLFGDCLDVLRGMPADSVDLIFTSPPYSDQRRACYGSVAPDAYVEWFLPRAEEMRRVLRPDGTFVLNIKERVVDGERHTYVLDLIKGMRDQGWRWTEEYIWHKKNGYPGKWPNRFRDLWERLLQFNRQRRFNMYQESVSVPVGDWARTRLANISETDRVRDGSRTGNAFGKRVGNWVGRHSANPGNVLHMATECGNQGHSAAFPVALPDWFIRLFTREGDTVLDPFLGSGTTLVAARRLGRNGVGIELEGDTGRPSWAGWHSARGAGPAADGTAGHPGFRQGAGRGAACGTGGRRRPPAGMIYRRAFVAEVLAQSVTTMCLLGLILMLVSATRALADLADVALDLPTLLLVVALGMLRHVPLLLSFALLAGLLATFDRMRGDRELLFWEVAGVGPFGWMRPTLGVALPFVVVSGLMAAEGSPWAGRTVAAIKRQASDEAEIVGRTGAFGEIGRLGIVYHITDGRTVLLRRHDTHNSVVVTRGDIAGEGEARALMLADGLMYSVGRGGDGRAHEIRFRGGSISITPPEEAVNLRLKSTPLRGLDLGSRPGQAEFAWRMGLPASLALLALIVPLLASRKARRSRAGSVLVAIGGYWFVHSVASLAKELGADPGPAPAAAVALLPHAALAAILAALALRAAVRGRPG